MFEFGASHNRAATAATSGRGSLTSQVSESLVGESHWPGTRKVCCFQLVNGEPRLAEQRIDFEVQMTTSSYMFPDWSESIPPGSHTGVRSPAVLYKDQTPA